ncbi:MAG TPA: UDP-N-acetylmuramoyl-L-alanine--D-glutamate ligase, partial [bacterium]|nr:UDP-N-acetylmuramoyl-L-alanine--D-glutamate ligase [bacterium]
PELVTTLGEVVPVTVARSMEEAVLAARQAAHAGDVVVLSPGCASFDWYDSYAERGDDFSAAVKRLPQIRP